MNSVLSAFLSIAKVKYTKAYLNKISQTHPNRNSLLGIKQVLDVYGIEAEGVKYEDKLNAELVFPCILHIFGDFVVAKDLRHDTITYIYKGKEVGKSVDEFCNIWTGYALLPTSDFTTATEPNYVSNRKEEIQGTFGRAFTFALPIFIWVIMFVRHLSKYSVAIGLECALEWTGLLLCYFLMEKQLFKKSSYGDKVCSAFHLNNCNDVLFSAKAKIGVLSWSEIGLGYFIARLIYRIIIPEGQVALALIGWMAMLYGIWSLWQQLKVLHNFCLLCTLVQVIIWMIGVVDISMYSNNSFSLTITDILVLGGIIILSILSTHAVTSYYNNDNERKDILWKLNSLKADSDVFFAKLQKGEFYVTTEKDSHIMWGNKDAKFRITILSNPHCNPCARMHKRVEELLRSHGDKLCVQYIFTSFNKELEKSSRFLIASYLQLDTQTAQTVFQQWFDGEKDNATEFMNKIPVDISSQYVDAEIDKHNAWCERSMLTSTPTILLNGHIFPNAYTIEDIILCT